MPSFRELFAASNGKPTNYNGTTISMVDTLPLLGARRLQVQFESTNSRDLQGIALRCSSAFRLHVRSFPGDKGLVLWRNTAPDRVLLELEGDGQDVSVYNVWQDSAGTVQAWHNDGAAMIVEEIPNGRRYRCNDGEPDDDFDDLIFAVERVSE